MVNGRQRFNEAEKLPHVQFVALTGRDGNRILDAVQGASVAAVERSIEIASMRATKDVSFGDVIGFCIEWCEGWVGGKNAL
jgi:hypothetical protein